MIEDPRDRVELAKCAIVLALVIIGLGIYLVVKALETVL